MLILRAVFLGFHGKKSLGFFYYNYCGVRTKMLHSIKVRKFFGKVFHFGLKQAKYLFGNKFVIHIGPESMI